jgi:hypothetical protein
MGAGCHCERLGEQRHSQAFLFVSYVAAALDPVS